MDSCSVTAAQCLSVDSGAAGAFPVNLGARRVPAGSGLSDAPDASEKAAPDLRNNARSVLHPIWHDE